MFIGGCFIKGIFSEAYHWDWDICFLFGAMSAATDPVAVVALLGELGAPESLGVLVEGESLINDGSAFVAFLVMIDVINDGELRVDNIFISFARLALAGAATGVAMGWIATQFHKHNYTFGDDVAELAVLIAVPYFTFWIAEGSEAQMSGVLACVCLTIYMKNYSHFHQMDVHSVHTVYTILCWIANTLVFMISGGMAGAYLHAWEWQDVGLLLILYVGLAVVRMLTIAILWYPLSKMGYGFDWKQAVVLTWGALRGAIGLAMAAIVAHEQGIPQIVREKVYLHMSGIVALTLVVNGSTMGWALGKLGYTVRSKARNMLATKAVIHLEQVAYEEITKVKRKKAYNHCDWTAVMDTIDLKRIEHLFCDESQEVGGMRKEHEEAKKAVEKVLKLKNETVIEDDEERHKDAMKHDKAHVGIQMNDLAAQIRPDARSSKFMQSTKLTDDEAYSSLREQFLQSFVAQAQIWREHGDLSATAAACLEDHAEGALDADATYPLSEWWSKHIHPTLDLNEDDCKTDISSTLHCMKKAEYFRMTNVMHALEISKSFILICQKIKQHVLADQHDDDGFKDATAKMIAEIKVSVREAADFVVTLIDGNKEIARQVDTRRAIGHVIRKMMEEINDMVHHGELHGDEKKMVMEELRTIERKVKNQYASATLKTNEMNVLHHTTLFQDLVCDAAVDDHIKITEENFAYLHQNSKRRCFEKDATIPYADPEIEVADGRHLMVVLKGHLEVKANGEEIHYGEIMWHAGPGAVIGAAKCVLPAIPWNYDIKACDGSVEVMYIPHKVALQVADVDSRTDDELWMLAATEIGWAQKIVRDDKASSVSLMNDIRDHHANIVHVIDHNQIVSAPRGGLLLRGEVSIVAEKLANNHKFTSEKIIGIDRGFPGVSNGESWKHTGTACVLPPGTWRVKGKDDGRPHGTILCVLSGKGKAVAQVAEMKDQQASRHKIEVQEIAGTPPASPLVEPKVAAGTPPASPMHEIAAGSPVPPIESEALDGQQL